VPARPATQIQNLSPRLQSEQFHGMLNFIDRRFLPLFVKKLGLEHHPETIIFVPWLHGASGLNLSINENS
jgi:hypothetical protein